MARAHGFAPNLATAFVLAGAGYTAALCFINTNVAGISNAIVATVDGAIILGALLMALHRASRWLWIVLAALGVNFLLLTLLSGNFEPKAMRDPLVLVTFAALGWRYGGFDQARRTFFAIAVIILAFAAFEYAAPRAYTSVFDIIDFYAARGVVDAQMIPTLDSDFFLSGSRAEERVLVPFLGPHRVSSIFLEPVSMGNFGALALILALSLDREHWRTALAAGVVAVATIVLADARFASMSAILFVVVRLLPVNWVRIGVPFLPLFAIGVLISFALSDVGNGDDLPTRLAGSGRLLLSMDPSAYFGLSSYEITTFDSGYAYAFSALGLPMCAVLWVAFVLIPTPTGESQRYKNLLAVYIAALLCISGTSLFALKTAALGFFILGALAARRAPRVAMAPGDQAPIAQGAPA